MSATVVAAVFATAAAATAVPAYAGDYCPANVLAVRVSTDRDIYGRGDPVRLIVVVENVGNSVCAVPVGPCLPQIWVVRAEDGVVVWDRAATRVVCAITGGRTLRPRAVTTATVTWDGRDCAARDPARCSGRPVAAARYRTLASWNSLYRGRAVFVVRASR